jgi:hypothetical protein
VGSAVIANAAAVMLPCKSSAPPTGEQSETSDPSAAWYACRFEELAYADAASYMEDGRVVFTGSPDQMKARLRAMGASVR